MAKRIMQFRYYGDGSAKNQPAGLSKNMLNKGSVFTKYLPFTQLGIQSLPGTRIYLNNDSVHPVMIGSTGIYELELEGISEIGELHFDMTSLEFIEKNSNAHLIIDVIYNA